MEKEIIIYQINLNDQDESKINKIINNNPLIKTKKIESLKDITEIINHRNLTNLVIRYDEKIIAELDFIYGNRAYFLIVNCLMILPEKNSFDGHTKKKLIESFKSFDILELEGNLIDNAGKISDFILNESNKADTPIYLPLDYKIFSNITKAPCDIFIKLSEIKFVKILTRGDDQGPSQVINKYTEKGVSELFVNSQDLTRVKELIKNEIFKVDTKKEPIKQKLQIAESVIAVARDFGVSEYLVEGINDTFKEISNDLSDDKKLENLLKMIKDSEGSIIANHSYMTAIFATLICSKTSWATSNVRKNISLAAILHDIELTTSAHYMYEFKSLDEINALDSRSAATFKEHSHRLTETLSKNSAVPSDAINLISKHHEGSKDNSYPIGVAGAQLSPPNCLFNVAHQFSIELVKIGFNYEKSDVAFNRLREHYSGGAMFKTFIDILENELKTKKAS